MRIFLVAALVLAGCTGNTATTSTTEPATTELSYVSPPTASGHNVTFTMAIRGPSGHSDHIGGHYWNATQADATAAFSVAKGCVHVPGGADFPATFTVTCATGAGTHFVRGHLRITSGTEVTNYWAPEVMVNVA